MTDQRAIPGEPQLKEAPIADMPVPSQITPAADTDGLPSAEHQTKGRSRFSSLHARTYEMELLLSAAVVFALAQLPPVVSVFFARFRAGLGGDLQTLGRLAETYAGLTLYALIAAFLLHLVLRAFWIGLLGLESVFPGGIRWDRLKTGPNSLERFRNGVGSLARSIDRADDLCSLIFSFGFLIAITFVYCVALVVAAAATAFAASSLFLGGAYASTLFWTGLAAVIGLQLAAGAIDKHLGPRLAPGGAAKRLLERLVWLAYALSPMRWTGAVQLTLSSNLSSTRVAVASVAAMLLLAAALLGGRLVSGGLLRLDDRSYFPADLREHGVDPSHYRDRRAPGWLSPEHPSIQAEVVEGPYLELSIPYLPERQNPRVADTCPDLEPLRAEGLVFGLGSKPTAERVWEAAACLGSLFEVRLDGTLLDELRYDFAIEPGSDLEALMARIPARDLAPGRHELVVLAPPRAGRAQSGPPDPDRHAIPFWR